MKAAYWGIAIILLGVLGMLLIDLFGNITVTNQLNYTTMKNAVEASMYDAVNKKYLSGFCLCTDKDKDSVSNKYLFNDKNEYDLLDVTYVNGQMTCSSARKNCELLVGEHRIDKEMFAESFVRRFAEMVNNTKSYRIEIQEVIEYPPKVSVRVSSYDSEFLPTDPGNGYTIVNQIDSIIETNGQLKCYYRGDEKAKVWDYCWGTEESCGKGYVEQPNVTQSQCINVCYCNASGTSCGIWAKKGWSGYDEIKDSKGNNITDSNLCKKPSPQCYYNKTTYQYCWKTSASECGSGYELEPSVKTEGACGNVCYCNASGTSCGIWAMRDDDPDWEGYTKLLDSNGNYITDRNLCKKTTPQCFYNKTTYQYCWGNSASECGSGYELEPSVKTNGECDNICYCQKNGTNCGIWAMRDNDQAWEGYERMKDSNGNYIKDKNKCEKPTTTNPPVQQPKACDKWHYNATKVVCKTSTNLDTKTVIVKGSTTSFKTCKAAYDACVNAVETSVLCEKGESKVYACYGLQTYQYSCSNGVSNARFDHTCTSSTTVSPSCESKCQANNSNCHATQCVCIG